MALTLKQFFAQFSEAGSVAAMAAVQPWLDMIQDRNLEPIILPGWEGRPDYKLDPRTLLPESMPGLKEFEIEFSSDVTLEDEQQSDGTAKCCLRLESTCGMGQSTPHIKVKARYEQQQPPEAFEIFKERANEIHKLEASKTIRPNPVSPENPALLPTTETTKEG